MGQFALRFAWRFACRRAQSQQSKGARATRGNPAPLAKAPCPGQLSRRKTGGCLPPGSIAAIWKSERAVGLFASCPGRPFLEFPAPRIAGVGPMFGECVQCSPAPSLLHPGASSHVGSSCRRHPFGLPLQHLRRARDEASNLARLGHNAWPRCADASRPMGAAPCQQAAEESHCGRYIHQPRPAGSNAALFSCKGSLTYCLRLPCRRLLSRCPWASIADVVPKALAACRNRVCAWRDFLFPYWNECVNRNIPKQEQKRQKNILPKLEHELCRWFALRMR